MLRASSALSAKTNYVTRFGVTQQKSGLPSSADRHLSEPGPRRSVARWTVARVGEHELSVGRHC